MALKYTREIRKFIEENYLTKGGRFCADTLGSNFTVKSINEFCQRNGITDPSRLQGKPFDLSRFQNITEPIIAYFLGLAWSDGHVRKQVFTMGFSETDGIEFYELIKRVANFKLYIRKSGKDKPRAIMNIYSVKFSKFLLNLDYGVKSESSPTKVLNIIPKNLQRYFWLGLFDADGCPFINKKTGSVTMSFAGSYNQDWSDLQSFLNELNCKNEIIRRVTSKGKSSVISLRSRYDAVRVLSILYKDYDDNLIGLKRKHSKFLQMKNIPTKNKNTALNIRGVTLRRNIFTACFRLNGVKFYSNHNLFEDAVIAYDKMAVSALQHRAQTNHPIENYLDISFHEIYSP